MLNINNISNENFYFQVNQGNIVFGLKKILPGAHFTLSYELNSPDINLHVTRVGGKENDKPKIMIAIADKLATVNALENFSRQILGLLFEPLYLENRIKQPKTGIRPF